MVDALSSHGETLHARDGIALRRFPDLSCLAALSEDRLRQMGFGYRAKTIPIAAQQILDRGGLRWLESLKKSEHQVARAELIQLAGVGPKLADCICLYALHHDSAVPVDTHVWKAATRAFFPEWQGTSLTPHKYNTVVEMFVSLFGDLAGYAEQLLFHDQLINWRAYRQSGNAGF